MNMNKKKSINADMVFYISMLAWPVLQLLVFYIIVNLNSFALAFEQIDGTTGAISFAGFSNFIKLFNDLVSLPEFVYSIKNSLVYYFISLLIHIPLGLVFAYYVYKKNILGGMFKVVLFLPAIIPIMVTSTMYAYFVDGFVPVFLNNVLGTNLKLLFTNNKLISVYVFNVFMGFGGAMLMYLGAMNNISCDVIEAAQIDGVNPFHEFFFIVMPQIFSTVSVFLITGVAGIFTNQMNLFTFFDKNLDPINYSMGYYLYKNLLYGGETGYPYLSSLGLVITVVVAPIVIGLRRLFNKIDPMN